MTSVAASPRPRWPQLLAGLLAALLLFASVDGLTPRAAAQGEGEGEPAATAPQHTLEVSAWQVLMHTIRSVGWKWGIPLGICSIAIVTLVVLLVLELRMGAAIPPSFVEDFTDTVNKRRFKEAYEMAKEDPSFVARVLTAGMSRLQYGIEDARDAALNMLESIRSGKEQINNYMAVIGTLGPLVGLVGTVLGMIRAFMALATGGQPNPAMLSKGISEALSITFLGIAVSVPAIFFNAFFRNRITKVSMDTGHIADDLLTQMYHNSKKAGAAPGAPAAPVAAAATVRAPATTAGIKPAE
jgi:biopolymer transport protein ExbB